MHSQQNIKKENKTFE